MGVYTGWDEGGLFGDEDGGVGGGGECLRRTQCVYGRKLVFFFHLPPLSFQLKVSKYPPTNISSALLKRRGGAEKRREHKNTK